MPAIMVNNTGNEHSIQVGSIILRWAEICRIPLRLIWRWLRPGLKHAVRIGFPDYFKRTSLRHMYHNQLTTGRGEYELRKVGGYIRPGSTAIDVGANKGIYSFEMSKHAARVIAFEPNPEYQADLRLLPRNVEVHTVALSDHSGEAELLIPNGMAGEPAAWASLAASASERFSEVRRLRTALRTLDSYALENVSFIKIDVEGYEEVVLRGAERLLSEQHPTLLIEAEEAHNSGVLERLHLYLGRFGYKGYFYSDSLLRPFTDFDAALDQKPHGLHHGAEINRETIRYINNFIFLVEPEG